jgi:hypothetical protein
MEDDFVQNFVPSLSIPVGCYCSSYGVAGTREVEYRVIVSRRSVVSWRTVVEMEGKNGAISFSTAT